MRAATRGPSSAWARAKPSRSGGTSSEVRPLWRSRMWSRGYDMASLATSSVTCDASVASPFRNFSRAGTLYRRSATSTVVPTGAPASVTETSRPASTVTRVAASSAARRVVRIMRDTLAIDGSASPRNPMLDSPHRRDVEAQLRRGLVAQLRRRVALEGEHGIFGAHPAAVVGHADQRAAACRDVDRHRARPGIDRVVRQLLDHRRGALDHLAGRDLIDHVRR